MSLLALDIGGANLKVADGCGFARSVAFPLWKQPQQLGAALTSMIAEAPASETIVATMTGELADCFATKAEGVRFIVDALLTAARNRPTSIYQTDGRLVPPAVAMEQPMLAAAANWHVLARFAARLLSAEAGLLIDIGSTTTDMIPIAHGFPASMGQTDTSRLLSGELVYTGVERSPLCAVAASIPYRGQSCPLAQEMFATMLDAYLVLGDLPEEPTSTTTANGRSATVPMAIDRLARSICADREEFDRSDAVTAADALARAQQNLIVTALKRVLDRMTTSPEAVVISGQGEFLAKRVVDQLMPGVPTVSLSAILGPELSRCATAHALAVVAREHLDRKG